MQLIPLPIKSISRNIPIFIGNNIWSEIKNFLDEYYPEKPVFMIVDSNIFDIYGRMISQELSAMNRFRGVLTFPAGERSKSRTAKNRLEDTLLQQKAGRDSLILAMGGGVTGDLAGFVAANLHRGISLIHIPTSLIAQVDSSIGGKVGINHPLGKNLLGDFHQPEAIFINVAFLHTLPEEEFRNGLGEVIKYAVILDEGLWHILGKEHDKILRKDMQVLEKMVTRCVKLKNQVVMRDEQEADYRSILNFGHTVGHAIEKLSKYHIKHGFAIASGMIVAAWLSHHLLGYPEKKVKQLVQYLGNYGLLRVDIPKYDPSEIWNIILLDKKSRQARPRFTLMAKDSKPHLFQEITKEELEFALRKC
jgi:3-dehydroquinate synthase